MHALARAHSIQMDAEEAGHLSQEFVDTRAQPHLELHILHAQRHLGHPASLGIRRRVAAAEAP